MQVQNDARKKAEQKVLELEAALQTQKIEIEQRHEKAIWQERDNFIKEINDLKLKVQQSQNKETRKIREIMRQEFEFQANQKEAHLNEQIKSLEYELAAEREKNQSRH